MKGKLILLTVLLSYIDAAVAQRHDLLKIVQLNDQIDGFVVEKQVPGLRPL